MLKLKGLSEGYAVTNLGKKYYLSWPPNIHRPPQIGLDPSPSVEIIINGEY
jgi:hypothetical protein